MSIYLLNLEFKSDADALQTGRFVGPPSDLQNPPGGQYFNASQVWLQYLPTTLPPWAQDGVHELDNSVLIPAEWAFYGSAVGSANMNVGDFIVARIFPGFDPNGGKLRCTLVFGRGIQGPLPNHPKSRQSPLQQVDPPVMPRSVIDSDPLDTSSWPPRSGPQTPWAWCLGKLHDDPTVDPKIGAHYSFNVGASYNPPGVNYVQLYGHDPTVIVKGGGGHPGR
jgi:hypothetical protein